MWSTGVAFAAPDQGSCSLRDIRLQSAGVGRRVGQRKGLAKEVDCEEPRGMHPDLFFSPAVRLCGWQHARALCAARVD